MSYRGDDLLGDGGFGEPKSSKKNFFSTVWNVFTGLFKGIGNWFKKTTGSGLTTSDTEGAALEYKYQTMLNEEEYQRKIDFYNQYESPEAMVRQYKDAGLNTMLLAGGGASKTATGGIGSAGSVEVNPSGSNELAGLLTGLLGFATRQQELSIADYNAHTNRMTAEADIKLKESQAAGQEITNDYLSDIYDLQLREGESNIEVKKAQADQLRDILESQECQRRLWEKDIEIKDMDLAIKEYTKAIEEAKAKYADEYQKRLVELQGVEITYKNALASGTLLNNTFLRRTLNTRVQEAEYALNHLIIKAGMDAEIFTGDAFRHQVEGTMTNADKWQMWTGVGTSILGTAASFAAPQLAAARVAAGMATIPASTTTINGNGLPGYPGSGLKYAPANSTFSNGNRPTYVSSNDW